MLRVLSLFPHARRRAKSAGISTRRWWARLIGSQPQSGPVGGSPRSEPNGWDNRTFRLGPDLLVRLPSAEAYAAQVRKEQRWLRVLAPHLPLPIPVPLAMGEPGEGHPWNWVGPSLARRGAGKHDARRRQQGICRGAGPLLVCLQRIDATGGPEAGAHNFFRGGPLETYYGETRSTIAAVGELINAELATEV